jgi:hypothetical protein
VDVEAVDRCTAGREGEPASAEGLDPSDPLACSPGESAPPGDRGRLERELEIVGIWLLSARAT